MRGWRDDAACLDDPEPGDWFAHPSEGERLERAVAVCQECPVAAACLEFAQSVDERWGVWGGLTAAESGYDRVQGLPETNAREVAIRAERRHAQEAQKDWTRRKGA